MNLIRHLNSNLSPLEPYICNYEPLIIITKHEIEINLIIPFGYCSFFIWQ
ncbi:hypothetical protein SAMN06265346_12070 [Flavobacterium hercynium]|nr:hypothetical protein SAMN06265346_12070 [Flavobacterium hercynium]